MVYMSCSYIPYSLLSLHSRILSLSTILFLLHLSLFLPILFYFHIAFPFSTPTAISCAIYSDLITLYILICSCHYFFNFTVSTSNREFVMNDLGHYLFQKTDCAIRRKVGHGVIVSCFGQQNMIYKFFINIKD